MIQAGEDNYGFEGNLPTESIQFELKASAKLFSMLSDGIYRDKILAVIRELSCNAHDAHVAAGKKNVPFIVRMPTHLDPIFSVEDQGTGIDPKLIGEIYWTYGNSTKTKTNDQIGALGLGSKSPFAYTKSSFVVKNRYQGTEYTYFCFIGKQGVPEGSCVSQEPTDLPSGVCVEMAVRQDDLRAFAERARRFFKRWPHTLPTFIDGRSDDVSSLTIPDIEKVVAGNGWYLEPSTQSYNSDTVRAVALMGGVQYPIDSSAIGGMPSELLIIAQSPFYITFDMASLNFTPSREDLQYDELTSKNVIERLEEVRDELAKAFTREVMKPGLTDLQFRSNFCDKLTHIRATLDPRRFQNESYFVKMLLDKDMTDTIAYEGRTFAIYSVVERRAAVVTQDLQQIGFFHVANSGRRAKLKALSRVEMTSKAPIPGAKIYAVDNPLSSIEIPKNRGFAFEWRDPVLNPKKKVLAQEDQLLANQDLFTTKVLTEFVRVDSQTSFLIDDCGKSADARYKLLGTHAYLVKGASNISLSDVETQLNTFIKVAGLQGARVNRLSACADLRETREKEPTEKGTINLKTLAVRSSTRTSTIYFSHVEAEVDNCYVETYANAARVKLTDLPAQIVYVVKRFSKKTFYDAVGTEYPSIIHSSELMHSLQHIGVFTDLIDADGRFKIYTLTEGEIAYLSKKGYQLKLFKELAQERVTELEAKEQFIHNATELMIYNDADRLRAVIESFDATRLPLIADQNSLFVELHDAVTNNSNDQLSHLVTRLFAYQRVTGVEISTRHEAEVVALEEKFFKAYPMLKSFNGDQDCEEAIAEYVNLKGV